MHLCISWGLGGVRGHACRKNVLVWSPNDTPVLCQFRAEVFGARRKSLSFSHPICACGGVLMWDTGLDCKERPSASQGSRTRFPLQ